MHPSDRYSTRYPNPSLEVDPHAIFNPGSRLDQHPTRLDSTQLDSKPQTTPLIFFTPDFKANSVHHKNQSTHLQKDIPLASS